MESDGFLSTRFKLFGLLHEGNTIGVQVEEFKEDVAQEKKLQTELESCSSKSSIIPSSDTKITSKTEHSLGEGTKTMRPLLPCFNEITVQKSNEEKLRYILKVNYDEHQYKTIVISPTTTSIAVCALLASKLSLNRFTFRLYALKNKTELHSIPDEEHVSHFLTDLIENSSTQPQVQLLVLRPPPTGTNENMRATVLKRWLNYQLKGKHPVKNLRSDLSDGKILCALAENLSGGKKIKKFAETSDKRENSLLLMKHAIDLLEEHGITLPHDAVQQIHSGDKSKICSILWSILYRYAVTKKSLGSANQNKSAPISELIFLEELYDWCSKLISKYPEVQLVDFNKSWRDGLALSAVLEQYDNYRVSYVTIKAIESVPDRLNSLFYALDRWFNLPGIITPKELLLPEEEIDDMSVIIFLTIATLHLHKTKTAKSKRSSMIGTVAIQGKSPVRIFVEGMEGIENKVLLLPPELYVYELRNSIVQKMKIASDSFWICVTESGTERLTQENDFLSLGDSVSVTIKMVAGSSFYNKETINPNSPASTRTTTDKTETKKKRRSYIFRKRD